MGPGRAKAFRFKIGGMIIFLAMFRFFPFLFTERGVYVAISCALLDVPLGMRICLIMRGGERGSPVMYAMLLPAPFFFPCVILDLGMVFCFFPSSEFCDLIAPIA